MTFKLFQPLFPFKVDSTAMVCCAAWCTLEGAVVCSASAFRDKPHHNVMACWGVRWCWCSNKDTVAHFLPDMSRFHFLFSKRCICTVVKYIHQQGFSIAIEERGGETQGLGEYNIVQTSWLGTAAAPCRPDCPCRSVLMSALCHHPIGHRVSVRCLVLTEIQ